ncbi:MAG: histidinol dehydrogenase [Alistipes sp.]|nr:histidinol dehydrogenase [Alistipes sp.]MBR2628492.1 histidinol dehydrogenase [Alistipes sp.]
MKIYQNPPREEWRELCRRAEQDNSQIAERVEAIVERVAREGDAALFVLAEQIDGVSLDSLVVTDEEFAYAESRVSDEVKSAIEVAVKNISAFHRAQLPKELRVVTQSGVECMQRPVAIRRVGLYIPGGTAPLFSTVLMLALPAEIAGCGEIILCTPTDKQGRVAAEVLYAARRCGVTNVYKAGGAQAIAAMAYGTESIPKVDKIFGPGNRYVTMAKQMVAARNTAIDMPAGPSEVMVLADASANPTFVAADMLSQAEHGRDSQAIVVCDSIALAESVAAEVERQRILLSRADYVAESLANSRAIVFDSRDDMVAFANEYAAEHLIVSMASAWDVVDKITAAGSIFIGNYSPESAGDYASGTNHTLPTSGWAHSCSGVNIDSFVRKITIQELSKSGIEALAPTIIAMAEAEGLEAHAAAVKVRIEN